MSHCATTTKWKAPWPRGCNERAELNRRVQVTATKSWPSSRRKRGAEVDSQVAAPAELRTPNLHRANIAHNRVRMEGWRQRRPGSNARNPQEGKRKTLLTHTGLLMEGIGSISRWESTGTTSDLEVCRLPISAKVGAYSCRTTLKRDLWILIPPL